MAYSFIETPPKSPLTSSVKKVWIGGMVLLVLCAVGALLIHLSSKDIQDSIAEAQRMQETLRLQSDQLRRRQAQFEANRLIVQQVATSNQLFAEQVFDLLDLIPDDTTLTRFRIDDTAVVYEGVCRDYQALLRGLKRALGGQYRLIEARHTPDGGRVRFTLKFASNGVVP